MSHKHKLVVVTVFTLLLGACGGGSSDPLVPTLAETGSMSLTIGGLPSGQNADVQITGPDSFSQAVVQETTLTELSVGDYQLTVTSISADGVMFSATTEVQTVTVSASQTSSVAIEYTAPATSVGVITGFGSVFVNGIIFNTDDAEIETDDLDDAPESELEVGMVVTVKGSVGADGAAAKALTIEYQAKVEGPVDAIDLAGNNFTVLGQLIFVDELTQYENTSFETLLIGDVVEVSALANEAGQQVASRVEKEDSGEIKTKLKGELTNLDELAQTFEIEQLLVDYSSAEVDGTLANDARVKVKSSSALVGGVLIADSVEVRDEDLVSGQQIAIDGLIDTFVSAEQFSVNGQNISTTENTEIKGGELNDLALALRVKVFGRLGEDNVLLAHSVRVDKEGVVKLEGNVESVDVDASTLSILGIVITADAHTHFIDKSADDIRRFSLLNMQLGDDIEVKAFEQDGILIARKIERSESASEESEDEEDNSKLEGPVTQIQENSFTIQGVTVHTSELTEFEGANDQTLNSAAFYALIQEGNEVEVEGIVQADSSIFALEVELEQSSTEKQVEFSGVVDSFESVDQFTVNGHDITTDFKTRYKNGGPDGLALGVELEIKGTQGDSGTILAKRIEFDSEGQERDVELEGEIDSFTSVTDFSLSGQAVITDENTEFKHGSAQDLALNISIELEGTLTDAGVVIASEIEFAEAEEVEVSGLIEGFVSPAEFMVNGQAVSTDENTEYKDGSVSLLAEGLNVEVEGVFTADNVLLASEIKFEEAEDESLEGMIESFRSATDFVVSGQQITTDEFTEYKDGMAENLAEGVTVEIEGFLNNERVLVASVIEFDEQEEEQEGSDELEGEIDSFTSSSDFSVDGQSVTTNDTTVYENGTVEDLALGAVVEIEGILNNEQVLVASVIKFEEQGEGETAEISLSGEIESFVSATEFVVAGQAITTNELTEYKDGTSEDLALTVMVKVTGILNDAGILVASKIEFGT